MPPVAHVAVHQRHEAAVVVSLDEVHQFVEDDVVRHTAPSWPGRGSPRSPDPLC